MLTINQVLKEKKSGLYFGNRVLLPFHCTILKIVIEDDVITDFSIGEKGAYVNETPDFTEIYFVDYPDLEASISKYENIKLIVVEKGQNIFDFTNHKKIAIHPDGNHLLSINELDENTIFIE